ncbi:MAG: GTP-binding protein [Candidatus Dormibacteria bacterium]
MTTPTRLLRIAAIGAVDDGKSTLVGRVLHSLGGIPDDELRAISTAGNHRDSGPMDLALATDGLRSERERGITIDVAYRYGVTPSHRLIIADCPGHFEYTRNMATGASTADVALVVVDVTIGLREQTLRHLCLAVLFGVSKVVVAVNKMDLVAFSEVRFSELSAEIEERASTIEGLDLEIVPVSALDGDNVMEPSSRTPWYLGGALMPALESAAQSRQGGGRLSASRLPVQWVQERPGGNRTFAGMLSGAQLTVGQAVRLLPFLEEDRVGYLETPQGVSESAGVSISVAVGLVSRRRLQRGDMIADLVHPPRLTSHLEVTLCWFATTRLKAGGRYLLKHTTRMVAAEVAAVLGVLDVQSLRLEAASGLDENQIGRVSLSVESWLAVDDYLDNHQTGSLVLIDPQSGTTVAAGLIGPPQRGWVAG